MWNIFSTLTISASYSDAQAQNLLVWSFGWGKIHPMILYYLLLVSMSKCLVLTISSIVLGQTLIHFMGILFCQKPFRALQYLRFYPTILRATGSRINDRFANCSNCYVSQLGIINSERQRLRQSPRSSNGGLDKLISDRFGSYLSQARH